MEAYKMMRENSGVSFCSVLLIVFIFYICQPLAYSEDLADIKTTEYVKLGDNALNLKPEEPFEIRDGRIIYNEHCAPCHGNTGKGDGNYYASGLEPKPRDFTDSEFMSQAQDEYLIEVIKKGTAAFGESPYCPPWGYTLKEEERIMNIVAFLRTLAGK